MPEDITKKLSVRFGHRLPLGQHATFTHEGETWIAYPTKKNTRILTLIDRLIGIHAHTQRDMMRIINAHPKGTMWIIPIVKRTQNARKLHRELIYEKMEAQTS